MRIIAIILIGCFFAIIISGCSSVAPGLFPQNVERLENRIIRQPVIRVAHGVGNLFKGRDEETQDSTHSPSPLDAYFSDKDEIIETDDESSDLNQHVTSAATYPAQVQTETEDTRKDTQETMNVAAIDILPVLPSSQPVSTKPTSPYPLDISISRDKLRFLANELERMIEVISSPEMTYQKNLSTELLQPNILISWFDLERPEPQYIYYRCGIT